QTGGYGAACQRAQTHFQALPRVPDVLAFLPGDRPAAASVLLGLGGPIAHRGGQLVLGVEDGRRGGGGAAGRGGVDVGDRQRRAGAGGAWGRCVRSSSRRWSRSGCATAATAGTSRCWFARPSWACHATRSRCRPTRIATRKLAAARCSTSSATRRCDKVVGMN